MRNGKPERKPSEPNSRNIKSKNLKTFVYALVFGVLSGVIVTFALSVFVPQFYTDWAGSLVCPGRIEYVSFKQSYFCYTAPNEFFNLGDAMFWAVYKRFIAPVALICCVLAFGFVKLAEFAYQRREAAGF